MKPSKVVIAVSVVGMILAAANLYLGALLPFLKAQSFIHADSRLASVKSTDDFRRNFDAVFDLYSPVGDEEIAKFLGNNILRIMAQGQPEAVSRELVAYAEKYLSEDDVRHLILMGHMREDLWQKYKQDDDYLKSLSYFWKAHEIGPNLPPPLYKLVALYAAKGDVENFKKVAGMILDRWPQDEKVRQALEDVE